MSRKIPKTMIKRSRILERQEAARKETIDLLRRLRNLGVTRPELMTATGKSASAVTRWENCVLVPANTPAVEYASYRAAVPSAATRAQLRVLVHDRQLAVQLAAQAAADLPQPARTNGELRAAVLNDPVGAMMEALSCPSLSNEDLTVLVKLGEYELLRRNRREDA